jgi:23S rRNA pseudouridine2604 synthase
MTEPVRLSKALSAQVPCSRREAELYIEGGWVTVDGAVEESPHFKVEPGQVIVLMPNAKAVPAEPATILMNKPAGFDAGPGENPASALIVPEHYWEGDTSRVRMLKRHFTRQTLTLPLERDDCGLMVYTQNDQVARKLVDDARLIEQEFIVEVVGTLTAEQLQLLNHGLHYKGEPLPAIKVSWQNETRLRFALKLPRPGQLRFMCESQGLAVVSVKRIRIGRIPMSALPQGQWRYLPGYGRF